MTRDKLNILFKNKRGQGGGPIEDIQISDDEKSAVITFKETEAVDLILNRGDTVTVCGKVVQVSAYFEKNDFDSIDDQIQSDEEKLTSPDKKRMTYDEVKTKKLKVFDLPEDMTRDKLNILFKNKRGQGGGPIEDIQISDDETSAIITFRETDAVDLIMSRGDKVTMDYVALPVMRFFEDTHFERNVAVKNLSERATNKAKSVEKKDEIRSRSENRSPEEETAFHFQNRREDSMKSHIESKDKPKTSKKKDNPPQTFERKSKIPENKDKLQTNKSKDKLQIDVKSEKEKKPKTAKKLKPDTIDVTSDLKADEKDLISLHNLTVKITLSRPSDTKDIYIYYLEDDSYHFGNFYEDSLMLDGLHNILYVTFEKVKDAENFCQVKHSPDINISKVVLTGEEDFKTYPNYIYLRGDLGDLDDLAKLVADQARYDVEDIIQHDDPESCIVVLEKCEDITPLTWDLIFLGDKKMITAPVYKTNSILVSGLTENISIQTLKRYLENTKRSGGGKVKDIVQINEKNAVVFFQDEAVLDSILPKKDHTIDVAKLSLSLYFPSLSKDYLSQEHGKKQHSDETELPTDNPLDIYSGYIYLGHHEIKKEGPVFIGTLQLAQHSFQFLSKQDDLQDIIEKAHCQMEMTHQKLLLTLNWPEKISAKEVKSKLEYGFKKLFSFLNSFSVLKFKMKDSEIHNFETFCKDKTLDFYFDHKSNEVTAIINQTSENLEALINDLYSQYLQEKRIHRNKNISMKQKLQGNKKLNPQAKPFVDILTKETSAVEVVVKEEKFAICKDVNLEKPEIILLQKCKFFESIQEKQKEFKLYFETNKVLIKGNDETQVNSALLNILEKCRNEIIKIKIDGLTPDQLELLRKETNQEKINSLLDLSYLQCSENDVKLFYTNSDSSDVSEYIKKVKSQVEAYRKKITSDMLSILTSSDGRKFMSNLADDSTAIKIDNNNEILIIAPKEKLYELNKEIESFMETNQIHRREITFSSGKQEFMKKYLQQEFKSSLGNDATVEMVSDKCIIKGLKDAVGHSEDIIRKIVEKIELNDVKLKFFGIQEFLQDTEGKSLLKTIEEEHRCVIKFKSETATTSKPKMPIKPPTLIAKCTVNGVRICFFQGNIFGLKADAVVNPLDYTLKFTSAINKALINEGGKEIQDEFENSNNANSEGSVIETSCGSLPSVKKIIHIVCPVCSERDDKQQKNLQSAIRACLEHAVCQKYKTISLPAIGLGKVFNFPKLPACKHLIMAVKNCIESSENTLSEIYVCDNKADNIQEMIDRCEAIFDDIQFEVLNKPKDIKVFSKQQSPSKSNFQKVMDFKNMKVDIVLGEINKQKTDVIVITVDKSLDLSRGRLAQVILKEAGDEIQTELQNSYGNGIRAGDFATSSGGNLHCKNIFHACLSRYRGDNAQMEKLVEKLLKEADKLQVDSISIPALGTGNLGYPADKSAEVIFETISKFANYSQSRLKVNIVVFPKDQEIAQAFNTVLSLARKGAVSQDNVEQEQSGKTSGGGFFQRLMQIPFKSSINNADGIIKYGSVSLKIKQGDITKERKIDVIVNGIKDSMDLSHSGQVCKTLLRTCGEELQDECNNKKSEMSQSGVVVTSAPKLSCKYIIHISQDQFTRHLDEGVTKILMEAEKIGASSLAMPVLGAGSRHADLKNIKKNILDAIEKYGTSGRRKLTKIKLVIFDTNVFDFFMGSEGRRSHAPIEDFTASKMPHASISQESELKIYSDDARKRMSAEKALIEKCKASFKKEKEKDENLKRLTKYQIKEIEHFGLQQGVKVTFRAEENLLIMEGFKMGGILQLTKRLKNIVVEAVEQHHKSLRHAMPSSIEWQYKHGEKWRGFDSELNSEIEREHKNKSATYEKVDAKGRKLVIDFSKKTEIFYDEKSGKKLTFEIRRYDKTQVGELLPKKWDRMSKEENLKIVTVKPGSPEYTKVEKHFQSKGANASIKKIERIQNKALYQQYSVKKRDLDLHNPKGHMNEMKLFHGTSPGPIPMINENGFNRSYCGVNGTAYGKGVYFALNSSYSVGYAKPDIHGNRHMYQVRVLVGENVQTGASTNYLPNKPSTNRPYDSGGDGSQIYVIFHDAQVYPEYLITF
ncbi:hypothetical protein Btru_004362 [Bulinus truncatus]|nr:hypothetical protein Btru_004362 [Bulinus truncatus]